MKDNKKVDLVGPVLLIGIGVVILLNNLNMLDWTFWDVLRLWPVLLVAAGLELIFGKRSLAGSIVSAVVVLAVILGMVWFSGMSDLPGRVGTYESVSFPRDGALTAEISVDTGVADVMVDALSDSPNLLEGEIYPGRRAELLTYYDGGATAEVSLSGNGPSSGWVGSNSGGRWNVSLNEDVLYDLSVDLGVGDTSLDLSALQLDEVRVDTGVGRIKVQLPAEGNLDITLDGGVGEIIVEVPAGMRARVYTQSGLVSRNLPDSWDRDGDTWTQDGFSASDNKARINISLGVGTVTVREVED